MVKDCNTELKILEAARRVFLKKGMAGARMQEIADEAGINKSLLHYYFRSKDKLFEQIFGEVIEQLSLNIKGLFEQDMSVLERFCALVDIYIDVLLKNRTLPLFVLNEINQNPDRFANLLKENIVESLQSFLKLAQEEIDKGLLPPINPAHLIIHVLSLIIFPFAVYPIIEHAVGEEMRPLTANFLEERKAAVKQFITYALTPKNNNQ